MSQVQIVANQQPGGFIVVDPGNKVTVTISGSWKYDGGSPPCGAAGVGGSINDNSFPEDGAPIGCCLWNFLPNGGGHIRGWFQADNQTITWGDTSPGDGQYQFLINDQYNHPDDNSGYLTLTYNFSPR